MERKSSDARNEAKVPRKVAGAALLQQSVTNALHRACFEEWAETGYAALRMDRIAARAGVGKAALYRRYKSKHELAVQAVQETAATITPIPDAGSLEGDLLALIKTFAVVLRHPLVRRILPDLHAERARSDELSDLLEGVTKDRRAQAVVILDRAAQRGELSKETSYELALDLLIAPLYWRIIVQRKPMAPADIKRISTVIISAVGAAGDQRSDIETTPVKLL